MMTRGFTSARSHARDESVEEVVAGVVRRRTGVEHRHGDHRRAGEARTGQVDRVARTRHDRAVARSEQHPHQVRETLLGADGRDDLGVGIDVDVKEHLVAIRHRETEVGDARDWRCSDGSWILRRLGEFGDRDVGARQVRVAEAEVDDVSPAARASALRPLICAKT